MADPRAFVCGHPISHSRSPLIHRHWLDRLGLPGSYEAIDVAPAQFSAFLGAIDEHGYVGGNITIPHKQAACELVELADAAARKIGAVNTVWLEEGRLHGTNTDWYGFGANMDECAPGWDKAGRAVVLGAGGAARGVVHALVERNIPDIAVVNRTFERAGALVADFGGTRAVDWNEMAPVLSGADVLVNTTSLGMVGHDRLEIDLAPLAVSAIVSDIVYVPLETALLRQARRRGNATVDGLGMLLHQAVPGFERWFGVRPTVTAELRRHIIADLEDLP